MGLLLFIVLPLTELYVLIVVGREIGFLSLLGLLCLSAFLGVAFAKREGLRVWGEFQRALLTGQEPTHGALQGVLVLLGGALLVVPGLVTDVFGLILIVPWTRRWVASALHRHHTANPRSSVFVRKGFFVRQPAPRRDGPRQARPGNVIETTGESVDDPKRYELP